MRTVLSVMAMLSTIAIATPSEACRAWRSPQQKLADGYRISAISAVALITIKTAEYTAEPSADAHPWSASAKIDRVVFGSYDGKSVSFGRGWGSAACDEGYPLPKPGDRWVVYFWKRPEGDQIVWATYPLAIASNADPSLPITAN
jgi:hypothetical protein